MRLDELPYFGEGRAKMLHHLHLLRTKFWPDKFLYIFCLLISTLTQSFAQQFASPVRYSINTSNANPQQLVTGDFDGDGSPDIATANYLELAVGVLLNRGDGTFGPVLTYPLGPLCTPAGLAAGDVNQDGRPDLVTANGDGNSVSILLNLGQGRFGPGQQYPMGPVNLRPERVTLADVDGDGRLDLLTATGNYSSLGVLLNAGNGQFQPVQLYPYAAGVIWCSLAVADINQDGRLDAVLAHMSSFGQVEGTISVLLNQGAGQFGLPTRYALATGSAPTAVRAQDLNQDGYPEVVTANYGADNLAILVNQQGVLQPPYLRSMGPRSEPVDVVVANVLGTSQPALVTVNYGPNMVGVARWASFGPSYDSPVNFSLGLNAQPSSLVAADFDRDGRLDIATSNSLDNSVSVLLNRSASPLAARPAQTTDLVELYPNPVQAGADMMVTLPPSLNQVVVEIVDALGRCCWRGQVSGAGASMGRLPTQQLAPGWYALKIWPDPNRVSTSASWTGTRLFLVR